MEANPLPVPYRDRSLGLIIFGVLTICLGCLCGLFVPLMVIGQLAGASRGAESAPLGSIVPGLLVYAVLAIALVWLGIGSVMARRWARALLLIFSWSWLVMGVLITIFMIVFLPMILANTTSTTRTAGQKPMPASAIGMVMVVMILVFGVLFVILPAVWTYFYQSRHVKATCEARNAGPSWTDACPLPVLAASLWLLFSAVSMMVMPLANNGVMPFFGIFLSGVPGTLYCALHVILWGASAWLLYRLEPLGWWLIVIALCVFAVSAVLTYAQHDVTEMYQLMGYPEGQIQRIQKMGLLTGNRMMWFTLVGLLPTLGYLIYVKKFLRR